jgi:hypothetical protein
MAREDRAPVVHGDTGMRNNRTKAGRVIRRYRTDNRYEHCKAGFDEPPGTKESCTKAKYSVQGYSKELLNRADAKVIFLEFYRSKPKPVQYVWRLMKFDGTQETDLP